MPRPKNEELPEALLNAARQMLVERGGPHFSMRELAAEVGYTLTAIYRCFDNRAALLRQLMLKLFAEFNAHCIPPMDDGPRAAIRDAGRRFVEWAVAHPSEYLFMFSEYGAESLLVDDEDVALARAGLEGTVLLLSAAQAAGELELEDPEATAIHVLTHLHGLCSLSLTGRLKGTIADDPLAFFFAHSGRFVGWREPE